MEDLQLNEIWKQYDRRLEEARIINLQSWALNVQNFEFLQTQKAKSALNSLITHKTILVLLGFIWVAFLAYLIYYSITWSKIFFVISAGAIAVITSFAIIVYIKHVCLIRQINNSDSVVDAQEKIARLQSSTLYITRILFLQSPFYCTWFLDPDMIKDHPVAILFITLPVFLFFTWTSIWLYRNIHSENMEKKWFKILFSDKEWEYVTRAKLFLKEIEDFKKNL